MSEYGAFAAVLEKRANASLEDVYSRQKARDEVRDLKASQKPSAYPLGALAGAAGGASVPTVLRVADYVSNTQQRSSELTRRVEQAQLANYFKSLGMKNPEHGAAAFDAFLRAEGEHAARRAVADDVRGAILGVEVLKENAPEALVNEFNERMSPALPSGVQREIAGHASPRDQFSAVLGYLGRTGRVGPEENKLIRSLAAEAGKVDEKAIAKRMIGEELGRAARAAVPFATLGAVGGLLAVRARRKQMKELSRAAAG